jgi:hypothetical protein
MFKVQTESIRDEILHPDSYSRAAPPRNTE